MNITTSEKPAIGTAATEVDQQDQQDWRLFKPQLDDDGSGYNILRQLLKSSKSETISRLDDLIRAQNTYAPQSIRLRVSACLLRDLIQIGWEFKIDSHWIFLRPAKSSSQTDRKENTRQQLLYGRNDQLSEDSNKKFIFSMERPTKYSSSKPVTDLIADGRRLSEQLERVVALPKETRHEALKSICQPYLQLVTDERDEFTNLRLIDIWRYFRHSWSTRYRSSPGRNLFYLIRDAAQPNHPVMGISALGNTVMQLTTRDKWLGWTTEGLFEAIDKKIFTDNEVINAFRKRLEEDYLQIYLTDLPVNSRIDLSVDDDTLSRLAVIEEDASKDRETALKEDLDGGGTKKTENLTEERLIKLTQSPLYKAKRARAVREILRAYRTLSTCNEKLIDLNSTEEGSWAIGMVIKQFKKRFSATSMMEITVCGAVAPYNHLLGGKLVCLMMMSPKVVQDYRSRYGSAVSIIASQMAGRPITKDPELAFLGTTSLYTDYSAQYNRVKLPLTAADGKSEKIEFLCLGRTEGFGSPNLSSDTEQALAQLATTAKSFRNVNYVFGEGQSPKLRLLREGFAALGLDQSNLLQHGSPRIIYGVALVRNLKQILLGIENEPDYLIDPESTKADQEITDFWTNRWLNSRLDYKPALTAVASSSPLKERVSRLIPERSELNNGQLNIFQSQSILGRSPMSTDTKADERLKYIRLLYRNESAFSDHVTISRLKELNIKTGLEDVVRKIVRNGGSVVITGNAGDGKTHTIMLMKNDLKEAEVITDASEIAPEQIISRWQSARDKNQPFCIAINEGPLVELVKSYRKEHPWLSDIQNSLMKSVGYKPLESTKVESEDSWKPVASGTAVIDLSLRRVLSEDLSKAILLKLTDDQWYQTCSSCPALNKCGVTYNRKMLREKLPQERMIKLLTTVGERGARVTFREALAYTSYLIFGGRSCNELIELGNSETSRYYWNAFEGEGVIFEYLSHGLDPLKQTEAKIDESLWRGVLNPNEFVGNSHYPIVKRNLDEVSDKEPHIVRDDFTALKRRWYFEHPIGKLLVLSEADKMFKALQDTNQAMAIRLSRLLALINKWWNKGDASKSDSLRLWTRLAYSPRSRSQAMVSGNSVPRPALALFRPELSPVLRAAFGNQPVSHLLLGSTADPRFARLVIDSQLLQALLSGTTSEGSDEIARRLSQFNDVLAQFAEKNSDVRSIEVFDPHSELRTTVVVDLSNRRYDSAV